MTKEQAILKIKSKPLTYLNNDQKTVAIGIINSIPEGEDVLKYFDFIMKRSDVGFKFDVAPEIATGRIAVVNEMKNLNINASKEIDINENKLIIGDNYEALKNLLLTHKEKIDVIYIDPPYNTEKSKEDGNASSKEGEYSKFIYKDKFGRNGWLNMLRERLILAKRLLTNEGVIFVSIDDNEQAYLKVLMDEIFGEENFAANIVWQSSFGGKNDTKLIPINTEYIICYSFKKSFEKIESKKMPSFPCEDELSFNYGKFNKSPLCWGSLQYQKSLDFILYIEKENDKLILNFEKTEKTIAQIAPGSSKDSLSERLTKREKRLQGAHNVNDWRWYWSKNTILSAWKNNFVGIEYDEKNNNYKIYQKIYQQAKFCGKTKKILEYDNTKKLFRNLIANSKITSKIGNQQLKSILNNSDFPYPKPVILIKKILQPLNKNAIVLDFFAGSGTTGHAVLELNQEDNGNRRFILVTNNENDIGINITYNRLYRIIKGQTIEGKKDFNWIKENVPYNNASLRVFNIKHFDVETNQSKKLDSITKFAIKNLNKLNPLYKIALNDIQIYYDLDGLNPLNEAQKKQLYSTDKIIHEKSKKFTFQKNYCTCGKSFNKNDELIQHIEKQNN